MQRDQKEVVVLLDSKENRAHQERLDPLDLLVNKEKEAVQVRQDREEKLDHKVNVVKQDQQAGMETKEPAENLVTKVIVVILEPLVQLGQQEMLVLEVLLDLMGHLVNVVILVILEKPDNLEQMAVKVKRDQGVQMAKQALVEDQANKGLQDPKDNRDLLVQGEARDKMGLEDKLVSLDRLGLLVLMARKVHKEVEGKVDLLVKEDQVVQMEQQDLLALKASVDLLVQLDLLVVLDP